MVMIMTLLITRMTIMIIMIQLLLLVLMTNTDDVKNNITISYGMVIMSLL